MCMYQVKDCYPMLQRVAVKKNATTNPKSFNANTNPKSFNSNTLEAFIFDG